VLGFVFGAVQCISAQEKPYFVTYSTDLEEPGNLEIALKGLTASPAHADAFFSPTIEMEYGATAWWTTEVYLQGQATAGDSTIFTGFRLENRFRPLPRQYLFTPVIYVEYEDVNDADKSILEVTGNDGIADLQSRNAESRSTVDHTLEAKLILSSNVAGWNISENFITEKNLSNHPWEYGYSFGVARPLVSAASAEKCFFCRDNLDAGAEIYGGLGTHASFGLKDTSHYVGPVADFRVPNGPTVSFSPQFGLNDNSVGVLWRFKVSFEVEQIRDMFKGKDTK
jgi:hypothetical protein